MHSELGGLYFHQPEDLIQSQFSHSFTMRLEVTSKLLP